MKSSPKGMDVSMKTGAFVLELLTVLCTDTAISTGCDSRVPGRLEGISGKHIRLVSANFKGASKFVSYPKYMKLYLCHVHDARRRDLEIPGGLALNVTTIISALDPSRLNNDLTERRSGRQRLSGNCTFKFDIESIPICDSRTPIHVTKVPLDHVEVTVQHEDSISGVPNAKQPESSWHRAGASICQLVIIESGLFEDGNLSSF